MIRRLLKRFGFYKIDYGFACGRCWVSVDEKVIAQTAGDDLYLTDDDVKRFSVYILGANYTEPIRDQHGNLTESGRRLVAPCWGVVSNE